METERLITQVGLLLSQTRFARRALEDIERETATYGTFAFTSVIAAGRRFGEPPLFDGALKVHIVNINDLGPGGGFGALIQGLLSGAGGFVGNLFGGLVGGAISTPMLIAALPRIDSIAGRIDAILRRLGVGETQVSPPDTRGTPVGGSNLVTMLESINRAVNGLTGLFTAAGSGPEQAATVSNLPSTPEGERWRRLLDSASTALAGVARVADGLIIVLPIALGSIASLVHRLGDIRVAVAQTLQFLLRNVLMLRGALAVTVFDTLALIARVAARTVDVLGTTIAAMVSAIFTTVREAFLAVLALGAVVGDAIRTTIQSLLDWIIPTIESVLRQFGNTRVFRVITHLVRILPAILPPIYELKTEHAMEDTDRQALNRAAAIPFLDVVPAPPGAGAAPGAPAVPPAVPDIAAILNHPDLQRRLTGALDRVEQVTREGIGNVRDSARQGLTTLGNQLDAAAVAETRLSSATLDRRLGEVRQHSSRLAESLIVPERLEPRTGLEAIAQAYESWLTRDNGLNTLLSTITRHFSGEEGRAGVPQRIVEGSLDRPRATIQIDEVLIEIGPAAPGGIETTPRPNEQGPGDFPLPPEGDDVERYARMWRDYRMRGGSHELLPALA